MASLTINVSVTSLKCLNYFFHPLDTNVFVFKGSDAVKVLFCLRDYL